MDFFLSLKQIEDVCIGIFVSISVYKKHSYFKKKYGVERNSLLSYSSLTRGRVTAINGKNNFFIEQLLNHVFFCFLISSQTVSTIYREHLCTLPVNNSLKNIQFHFPMLVFLAYSSKNCLRPDWTQRKSHHSVY